MNVKHISEVVLDTKKYINDRKQGLIQTIKTPWQKYNDATFGGFEWGDMTVLAGLSSSGKTAWAAQFIREVHNLNPTQDICLLFFTFEMPAVKILIRDIIANTNIRRKYVLSAQGNTINETQESSIDSYLNTVKQKDIYFIETPCNIQQYEEICREYYIKTGKKIIAISDHSLLFKGKTSGDERGTLVNVAESIVSIKNEGWSSHILLSQLNREIESAVRRTPKSPLNFPDKSCLFGSDGLYQCADNVIVIHRPYLLKFVGNTYGPDELSTDSENVYYHLLKVREGEPCILKMKADFLHMAIHDAN